MSWDAEVVRPSSLDEAVGVLAARPELRVLAGGTDLMVGVHAGGERPKAVLDVWGLDELRTVSVRDGHVVLGASTTYADLIRRPEVADTVPLLSQAAASVGAVQIQNRGTLGGNIVNASPAGDTLPPLVVYDAELELRSVRGWRRVRIERFYTGYKQMDLAPDELLVRILVPIPPADTVQWFRKVGTRRAQAISKVVGAGSARRSRHGQLSSVRLALGSVAPTVLRLVRTEAVLEGRRPTSALVDTVRRSARDEVCPIDDVRSTARYRRLVSGNIVARFVAGLMRPS